MGTAKKTATSTKKRRRKPAASPEAMESRCIMLAYDLAEQQLREGTASSQTLNHFLDLGSSRSELKREKLENENTLLRARADEIFNQENASEKYAEVIAAVTKYRGLSEEEE